MRVSLCIALVLGSTACGPQLDPNGTWSAPDAKVFFYAWDGGTYWGARSIFLRHSSLLFDDDCGRFETRNNQLTWVKSFSPNTRAVVDGRAIRLLVDIDDQDVHQGFHINHRDAGTVGLVRLSFDAGFFFEGTDRGVLRWRADYRDDVRQLATEGGEAWLDRHQVACF